MFPSLSPVSILSILIALSVHEAAHGFMADRLGDPTAKYAGRLTLNPLAHLDLYGTILFLVIGFGWGKPVPIDPRYFRFPKRDTALTAIAGPVSNLLLALISFTGLLLLTGRSAVFDAIMSNGMQSSSPGLVLLSQFFIASLILNLGLMSFNLIPVPPLDGSNILQAFIPLRFEDRYQEFLRRGPFILLILLLLGRVSGFDPLGWWIEGWINGVVSLLMKLVGG